MHVNIDMEFERENKYMRVRVGEKFPCLTKIYIIVQRNIYILTIGLSGILGSEITKFFSMRSNVVARSIPWRISLSLSVLSQLSERSISVVIKTSGSTIGSFSSLPAVRDFDLVLQENINI